MKSYIVLCLENNWIIKLLFNNSILFEYDKKTDNTFNYYKLSNIITHPIIHTF